MLLELRLESGERISHEVSDKDEIKACFSGEAWIDLDYNFIKSDVSELGNHSEYIAVLGARPIGNDFDVLTEQEQIEYAAWVVKSSLNSFQELSGVDWAEYCKDNEPIDSVQSSFDEVDSEGNFREVFKSDTCDVCNHVLEYGKCYKCLYYEAEAQAYELRILRQTLGDIFFAGDETMQNRLWQAQGAVFGGQAGCKKAKAEVEAKESK